MSSVRSRQGLPVYRQVNHPAVWQDKDTTAVPASKAAGRKPAAAKREPNIIQKSIQYVKESWAETRRATGPRGMRCSGSIAVFMGIFFVGIYVFVVDMLFAWLTRLFFGAGR